MIYNGGNDEDSHFPVSTRVDLNRANNSSGLPATRILDVPVSIINMEIAIKTIFSWIEKGKSQYICVRDVHGVMRAQEDPELLEIHNNAGMVTPDGMPLVWITRWRGYSRSSRVCGADLVAALCAASAESGIGHYFYGGKPGVA